MLERALPVDPVGDHERIPAIDILRGLAILFILVENMAIYSGQPAGIAGASRPVDRLAMMAILFFLQAKSYSLLSFLFGWGVAVQRERIEAQGGQHVPFFLRRMGVLLLLGLAHGTLIWFGDVLVLYAAMGLLLLPFLRRSPRTLLIAALLCFAFTVALNVPGETMDVVRGWYASATAFMRSERYPESLYRTGTFAEVTRRRMQDFWGGLSWVLYYLGSMLGMFLLGMYAARRRLLRDAGQHLSSVRKVMWTALAVGLFSNELYVETELGHWTIASQYERLVQVGTRTVGAVAFTLFYVAAVVLLSRREQLFRRLEPLAKVGRMSVSNYLFQSVVSTAIFYTYGLGLYGQVSLVFGIALSAIIYVVQVRLSEWWLDRYRFGPVEWLWRSLSYGRRMPLGIVETYAIPAPAFWQKAIRRVRGLDRRFLYISLIAVIVCGIGLVYSYTRAQRVEVVVRTRQAVVRVTPTPTATEASRTTAVATPVVQPVTYQPGSIAASGDLLAFASTFDAQRAVDEIATLTGPPYLGRYPASAEGVAAGEYIAERFAEYGLRPAGEEGTFYQSFPVEYVALADEPRLVVTTTLGAIRTDYAPYRDYSPMVRQYAGAGVANGEVVWGNECTAEDLDAVSAVDAIVLCRDGPIVEAQRSALEHGADGLLMMTDPQHRMPDFGSVRGESWVPVPLPSLWVFPVVVEDLLSGSERSIEDLSSSFTAFPLGAQAQIEIATIGAEACPQRACAGRNVLGVLPGRDPEHAHEVIILGAHYDHLGQSPGGTAWVGANDDASGVAVLLEVARTWHAQGYVPRRTVLFAAWDAEEMGLLGSRHYVDHPRYPLGDTVAMLQLDMVGEGGNTLQVDGGRDLGERLGALADAFHVETALSQEGRSDHAPFWQAGVPASLLIWSRKPDAIPLYHRPADTVETIEADKLDMVGKIAEIALLGLAEGELGIADLLAARADAVERGDLDAFLATSTADQRGNDAFWFADLSGLAPSHVEMAARDVRVQGRTATAMVQVDVVYPDHDEGKDRALSAFLRAGFEHVDGDWRWAGPDLAKAETPGGDAFAVFYPGTETEPAGLGRQAAERYAEMARLLGLPDRPSARLLLLPSAESLRANTALSAQVDNGTWVAPGVVKLVYTPEISGSVRLNDALAQLMLSEAGVTRDVAPWLWRGLPLVMRAQMGYDAPSYLSDLQDTLATRAFGEDDAGAWAAVVYLQERAGWAGLGHLIADLGQACREGLCAHDVDQALLKSLQQDSAAFENAWQAYWRERLVSIQAALDDLLAVRTEAVLSGDMATFLGTVDRDLPNLATEQERWFAQTIDRPLQALSLSGRPLAMDDDGHLWAAVSVHYRLAEDAAPEVATACVVKLTPANGGYRWAGMPFESLGGDRVRVLYPAGAGDQAQELLQVAEPAYGLLAQQLGLERVAPLVIKLYADEGSFRSSIGPLPPSADGVREWTVPGGSIKLVLHGREGVDDYRSRLAVQLGRYLLYQMGVSEEWLLKGTSLYLARVVDGGAAQAVVTSALGEVLQAAQRGSLYDLRDMPRDDQLSGKERSIAQTQAWDAVCYLVYSRDQDALLALLRAQGRGDELDTALRKTVGQSLGEFTSAWKASLVRAHALPEWVDVAQAFDSDRAYGHVQYLSGAPLAGRQAGSPGAAAGAAYVAARLAEYGVHPAGDAAGTTFLQSFPITYTVLLQAPQLELLDREGQVLDALVYRQDFVSLLHEVPGWGDARGELVWVKDADYTEIELGGKIAVRMPSLPVEQEVDQAMAHGAGGLLLVGKTAGQKRPLAKYALPATFPLSRTIPVLELTQQGFERLLELAGETRGSVLDAPPAMPLALHAHMNIDLRDPERVETANVIGLLPGSDPVLSEQVIVLSAHYDHVGDDPDGWACPTGVSAIGKGCNAACEQPAAGCERVPGMRYPGANDNASGVGVLLEIARLWHEAGYHPRRSVLFAAWGAQEAGQAGLRHYMSSPVVPMGNTVAVLHLDAVGGGDGYYLGAQGSKEREGLLRFTMQAAEDMLEGRLTLTSPPSRGDPASVFREAGIPTLWLSWREASEENWPVDDADVVEPYRLGVTGKMVTLALMALAQ